MRRDIRDLVGDSSVILQRVHSQKQQNCNQAEKQKVNNDWKKDQNEHKGKDCREEKQQKQKQ